MSKESLFYFVDRYITKSETYANRFCTYDQWQLLVVPIHRCILRLLYPPAYIITLTAFTDNIC